MATFYLVIVPQGVTPTWSRSNVATNSGWTATTIAYHDADTDPGSGTTYVFTPDASGLIAGTPYDLWAVHDDGVTTVGPVQGTGFSTASAGASGSLSVTESGDDTLSASGALIAAGALAASEPGADTIVASGDVIVAGQFAVTEAGGDAAAISGGSQITGSLSAQEAGSDTAAASGAVVVSGDLSASEAGADGFAASGSIGAADIIGSFAALESGADTISVSGVVVVSGALAATETGSDTMQTDTGEGYPSSVTITVPAGRLLSAASGRTITLRAR